MTAFSSRLTSLQASLLEAFFRHEDRFYLTGGGALAGYHLGHRETHDLDLFALAPIMEDGVRALRQAATDVGASWLFANKLCALLGRSEIRDLVDVRALDQLGLSLSDALAAGQRRHDELARLAHPWRGGYSGNPSRLSSRHRRVASATSWRRASSKGRSWPSSST